MTKGFWIWYVTGSVYNYAEYAEYVEYAEYAKYAKYAEYLHIVFLRVWRLPVILNCIYFRPRPAAREAFKIVHPTMQKPLNPSKKNYQWAGLGIWIRWDRLGEKVDRVISNPAWWKRNVERINRQFPKLAVGNSARGARSKWGDKRLGLHLRNKFVEK